MGCDPLEDDRAWVVNGERIAAERRCASSLLVRPTGTGATLCDGGSGGPDVDDRPSLAVLLRDPASSGAATASVGLNGIIVICEPASIAALEKDDPADLRKPSCLRRRRTKAMVPATRIRAATPPAIIPAIAPVCDDDDDDAVAVAVALAIIGTTGALRR